MAALLVSDGIRDAPSLDPDEADGPEREIRFRDDAIRRAMLAPDWVDRPIP